MGYAQTVRFIKGHKRFTFGVAGLALAGILMFGGTVAAAFPDLMINVFGGAQYGSAGVTGECQEEAPVTVTFSLADFDAAAQSWSYESAHITGINTNCTSGVFIVNGDGASETEIVPVNGEATVMLSGYTVGGVNYVSLLLSGS